MALAETFSQAVPIDAIGANPDAPTPVATPYSVVWWANELEAKIRRRNSLIQLYEDYYEGRHKMTFASAQFREAFAAMLSAVSDNWIPLVINASVERLNPQGFTFGDSQEGDKEAWKIWQASHMDADAPLAFTEACKHAASYLLVWPEEESEKRGVFGRAFAKKSDSTPPKITVEHPSQMIVARAAGDRRKIEAAFKCWIESDGTTMGTLYLPDATYRLVKDGDRGWQARKGVDYKSPNRLGIVPVVPIVNDPHMLGCRPPASILAAPHGVPDVAIDLGRSDQADIISTIDQINKLVCDMMVSSETAAFKQRWATGLDVPRDETTGDPIEPFKAAVDRLWIAEGEEGQDVRFGEFTATDTKNYIVAIENRIQSLAARTRTPPHYLLGSIVNASGDALKAAETGLASKVKGKSKSFGEGLEEALRIAFAWMGDDRQHDMSAEVVWGPFESRSESEYVDSLVKKMAIGVPKEQLWKDAGYSPQEISRFKEMLLEEGMRQDIFGVNNPAPPPAATPAEPEPTDGLPVS
jgi:hypothetical protein